MPIDENEEEDEIRQGPDRSLTQIKEEDEDGWVLF